LSIKDPYAFLESKVKKRAKETSNIKNALLFDMDYKPQSVSKTSELDKV